MAERDRGDALTWAGLVATVLLVGWCLGLLTCSWVIPRVICAPCAIE